MRRLASLWGSYKDRRRSRWTYTDIADYRREADSCGNHGGVCCGLHRASRRQHISTGGDEQFMHRAREASASAATKHPGCPLCSPLFVSGCGQRYARPCLAHGAPQPLHACSRLCHALGYVAPRLLLRRAPAAWHKQPYPVDTLKSILSHPQAVGRRVEAPLPQTRQG